MMKVYKAEWEEEFELRTGHVVIQFDYELAELKAKYPQVDFIFFTVIPKAGRPYVAQSMPKKYQKEFKSND